MHNECGQAGSNPIFYYTFGREPTKTHVPSAGVPAVLPSAQRVAADIFDSQEGKRVVRVYFPTICRCVSR